LIRLPECSGDARVCSRECVCPVWPAAAERDRVGGLAC